MDGITTTTAGKGAVVWAVMVNEITAVLFDLRWMIVACVFLIYLDFHFGSAESRLRHKKALEDNNATLAKMYEFHLSRAIRRTFNKGVDYLTWLLAFTLMGMAICEPLGICSHVITAAAAVLVACIVEIYSAAGHFCYLKGINVPKVNVTWKSFFVFLGRFAAGFARTKDEDLGNALDETIEQTLRDDGKDKERHNRSLQENDRTQDKYSNDKEEQG